MEFNEYNLTVQHDAGQQNIKVIARDMSAAIKIVAEAEGCPEGAITERQEFSVLVGNVGSIACENKIDAEKSFNEYVEMSKAKYGRASGEDVYLMEDGEPVKEYWGTQKPVVGLGVTYQKKYRFDNPKTDHFKEYNFTLTKVNKSRYKISRMTFWIAIVNTDLVIEENGKARAVTKVAPNYRASYQFTTYFDKDGCEILEVNGNNSAMAIGNYWRTL